LSDLDCLSNLKYEELIFMRKAIACAVIILSASASLATAQNAPRTAGSGRKVISRVAAVCPELARKMHISGTVKVEAIVKPNGDVKNTRVLGGNPVLVDAASEAVAKWKFEAAPNETTEVVQVVFNTD
jgi:TonB family protein